MLNASVARRYARALFDLAQDQGAITEVGTDLEKATALLSEHRDLRSIWEHEEVSARVKLELVEKLLAAQAAATVKKFLSLLVTKRREKWLPDILREYRALGYAALGVVQVEVRSAAPLPPDTLATLQEQLRERLGAKQVELATTIDRDLLGGVAVRVGDLLYDGSIRTQLKRIHRQMAQGSAL